jgi:hypothetical protein
MKIAEEKLNEIIFDNIQNVISSVEFGELEKL